MENNYIEISGKTLSPENDKDSDINDIITEAAQKMTIEEIEKKHKSMRIYQHIEDLLSFMENHGNVKKQKRKNKKLMNAIENFGGLYRIPIPVLISTLNREMALDCLLLCVLDDNTANIPSNKVEWKPINLDEIEEFI